ncbi:HRDC domain-containing protein [Kandleria vitulina]|jgi:ribonuclease D|uniref:HRDC domain-containing protein n=1 Tax=Kandleria vitulina TaxID=1630 RepID=UPI00048BA9E8|nr:HRDC domain-containing protein [Kandleria vitulina]
MTFQLNADGELLLKQLKSLRSKMADEALVPVYFIFSNNSLMDMIIKLPKTKEEMLMVERVGEKGYNRYGEPFLKLINEFTKTHTPPFHEGKPFKKPYRSFLNKKGRELFQGLSLIREEIAKRNNMEPSALIDDQTITNLIVLLPFTREEFIRIIGVRKDTRELYMDVFLEFICVFTNHQKERYYHIANDFPEEFFISKNQAERFVYKDYQTASEIAKALSELNNANKLIKATDITRRIKKYDCYYNDPFGHIIITDAGYKFGLVKEERTGKKGKHYEVVLYNKEAQKKIVNWFIKDIYKI